MKNKTSSRLLKCAATSVVLAGLVAGSIPVMGADGGTEVPTRSWVVPVATTNAIFSFDYSAFAQPVEDCFETVIEDTLTNVVVGTNIAQVWIGFDGVAGTCYSLEYLDHESQTWFSSGALLNASTNGFYKLWDDVNVGSSRRIYRMIACANEIAPPE